MFFSSSPIQLLALIFTLIVAISFHEAAHALTAVKLGDNTPKQQGRLTLNPLMHLDIFGSLALLLVGFGWGKPVQVNPNNFENKRRDMMLVALAGPMTNFLLAFCGVGISALLVFLNPEFPFQETSLSLFLLLFIHINIFLGVFNLLPLPPLDGGSVLLGLLPKKIAPSVEEILVTHGQVAFFVLLGIDLFLHIPLITGPIFFISQYILVFFQMVFAF